MCGLLKDILPLIKETCLDGINGLTPPPIGDTPFEYALDILGKGLIILGGLPDANLFQNEVYSADGIKKAIDILMTDRIKSSHFLLWVPADGLPTKIDKFLIVRDWIEKNGWE